VTADARTVAAIDLGSNSFHMVVARFVDGRFEVLDRIRERVALAEGLGADGKIAPDARERALNALDMFGQRIKGMPAESIRVVGTNTFRKTKDTEFLRAAEERLGARIEVIAGREEARLIYLGVSHSVNDDSERRLVVDIGGGSTEFIIGEGFDTVATDSLHMGCVTFSDQFFGNGKLSKKRFVDAQTAAALEVSPIESQFKALGWDQAIGSSGTVTAVHAILEAQGWSAHDITLKNLVKLRDTMIEAEHVSNLKLAGLPPDRAPVLAGGLAILIAVFTRLGIQRMDATDGALREGLLYDLLGRIQHEDVRDHTVRSMCERYRVDLEQAARVDSTAVALLQQVKSAWGLEEPEFRKVLRWAARLHEIGKTVAYSGHHKHGAYLLKNSDMPGFSNQDQAILSALVGVHRRRMREEFFERLSRAEQAKHLCVVLRLAVLLNRNRDRREVPRLEATASRRRLDLRFPPEWLESRPLLLADLERERAHLAAAGFEITVR
jgi:exopolyphosphatase/guanosine-5'-triphosphate,3'-diphosphate pyrophosphatase